MTYRPVVDHVAVAAYLDPISATFFVTLFVASAILTMRRPMYGLCAMILTTPIEFSHDVLSTTVTLPKCVLLGVLLGLTVYPGGWNRMRRRPARLLLSALGLYVVAVALTIPGAGSHTAALRETFKWIEYAVIFVTAFLCYSRDAEDAPILAAVAIAAIVVSLSALVQEVAGAPSGLYIGSAIVPRVAGLLEGPNQLSAYCAIAIATLSAWRMVARSALAGAAIVLVVCADVLTFSRAGLVAMAIVVAIVAAWGGRRAWPALRPALAGGALGLAGAVWWAIYAHTPGILRVSLAPSAYAGGVGNRNQLWSAALRMWREHPILGVGAGNYELDLPKYGVYGVRTHANSWYLQSLAEGGIALFAATLAVGSASIAAFLSRPWLASLRTQSPWVAAALAASVALILHQVVDDFVFYPKVGGAWWILLGIAAAAYRRN